MTSQTFTHQPVLLNETVEGLNIRADGIYVDATFGRGGHSFEILKRLSDKGRLVALDRDLTAIEAAARFKDDPRFEIHHTPFANIEAVLTGLGLKHKVDGILMDIGVSSPQLDDSSRGFSFQKDGPLDMRMDTSSGISAAQWLNTAELDDITHVLKTYGEEKFGKRIATAVVEYRANQPIKTTQEFVDIIDKAMPVKDKHKHPATRSFQGVRIFINGEIEQLEQGLQGGTNCLATDGRLAIISFHSLEDRIVKRFIKAQSSGLKVPAGLPIPQSDIDASKVLKPLSRAIKPSQAEIAVNPRSRSSVLRIAAKL
jgi:16S rRNA (cytosine1402-N4)-methyltransferase